MAVENSNRSGKGKGVWLIDYHQLDILLSSRDGKPIGERPWITAVMDEDGSIQGMWVSVERPDANSFDRLLTLVKLTDDPQRPSDSLPIRLYLDNDLTSSDRQETVQPIPTVRAAIGKPQGKSVVERFFGKLSTELPIAWKDQTASPMTLQQLQKVLAAYIRDYNTPMASDISESHE